MKIKLFYELFRGWIFSVDIWDVLKTFLLHKHIIIFKMNRRF